ncbi:hypothetical protein [Archaeoglobus veneficus]|uniref:Uncharacterized protein n=1 Tax=Archaeoglobus veneficus (strain DSM 11195 / SNP6) TaxID=693661 RepID=F2KMX9_ARCVS|nr:hypothetical protein [Archaeoglobus veneficus]AEA47255.1 hypothetical protein Arcve_1248 [Archaeoglobus veneficus SNP6]
MWKSLVALIVGLLAISPLLLSMASYGPMGGKYITDNNYRHFSPYERSAKYTLVNDVMLYLNKIAELLLVIGAFFVFIMTVLEYWKFDKMYKLEQQHHGGGRH